MLIPDGVAAGLKIAAALDAYLVTPIGECDSEFIMALFGGDKTYHACPASSDCVDLVPYAEGWENVLTSATSAMFDQLAWDEVTAYEAKGYFRRFAYAEEACNYLGTELLSHACLS